MSRPVTFQAIGECMVEVVGAHEGARIGYAGDTYNAAVYLSRVARCLGTPVEVHYLTGVGDDPESAAMRERWVAEGIADDAVVVPGATPGLYVVRVDERGERSFSYWRSGSAAARLLATTGWVDLVGADLVHLSGITLQMMTPESRTALLARLGDLRAAGTRVVLDGNYRPAGWPDVATARRTIDDFLALTDVALVTWDDELLLGGADAVERCAERIAGLGVAEVVVKDGPRGAWVLAAGELRHVATTPVEPVDTTAAGDSFNGGYLAARLHGRDPARAAAVGHLVAAAVVGHRGAIIDDDHMPAPR